MISLLSMKRLLSLFMLALPLSLCLFFLFPTLSYARAILILSDLSGEATWPTFFSLVMVILVNLGVVFWVGAQLWHAFVLQTTDPKTADSRAAASATSTDERVEQRFARRFALPVLLLLLIASIGVLIGQSLLLRNGRFDQALSLSLLINLASNGQFGLYWSLREMIVVLALALAACTFAIRKPSLVFAEVQLWVNLLLALALLFVVTSSNHTATITNFSLTLVVLVDWLHLLAASLWVGGMFYLYLVYLPVLRKLPLQEQASMLLKTLTRFSPLAITGIVLMAVTGPLDVTMHVTTLNQLWLTAYGQSLLLKILLVACLLLTNAVYTFFLGPRLAKMVQAYEVAKNPPVPLEVLEHGEDAEISTSKSVTTFTTAEMKRIEGSIAVQTNRLLCVVRWESLLGIGILICTGLLSTFASTSQSASMPSPQSQAAHIKPFTTTLKTTDNQYKLQLQVSPNHIGNNVFTIHMFDNHDKPISNVVITIYTTMLDMDMGTDAVHLQSVGNGVYSAPYQFTMAGGWQLLIKVRVPDSTIHETTIDLNTPF